MNPKQATLASLVLAVGTGTLLLSTWLGKDNQPSTPPGTAVRAQEAMPAAPVASPRQAGPRAEHLRPVPSNLVCMVNNRLFATPQIPVEVEGRTYYGCCEGCKENLKTRREARMAVDPVSGKEVDKALAAIGAMPDGRVFYFVSTENLAVFDPATVN